MSFDVPNRRKGMGWTYAFAVARRRCAGTDWHSSWSRFQGISVKARSVAQVAGRSNKAPRDAQPR
jgi:hypothetical protein